MTQVSWVRKLFELNWASLRFNQTVPIGWLNQTEQVFDSTRLGLQASWTNPGKSTSQPGLASLLDQTILQNWKYTDGRIDRLYLSCLLKSTNFLNNFLENL